MDQRAQQAGPCPLASMLPLARSSSRRARAGALFTVPTVAILFSVFTNVDMRIPVVVQVSAGANLGGVEVPSLQKEVFIRAQQIVFEDNAHGSVQSDTSRTPGEIRISVSAIDTTPSAPRVGSEKTYAKPTAFSRHLSLSKLPSSFWDDDEVTDWALFDEEDESDDDAAPVSSKNSLWSLLLPSFGASMRTKF